MIYIDIHAHICKMYDEVDSSQLIKEAKNAGVMKILNVSTDVESSKQVIKVAKNHKNVHAVIGIHPVDGRDLKEVDELEALIVEGNKVVGIGEIGLDYFHIKTNSAPPKEVQKTMLKKQLEVALKYDLPVVFHCRDAIEDLYEILATKQFKKLRGVMHTFAGNPEQAKRFMELGFYISFSGVVTFKNAPITREVAKIVPLDRIFSETDTPFLTPVPLRGKKNHTRNVVHVANKIAEVKQVDINKLCEQIEKNVFTLFGV